MKYLKFFIAISMAFISLNLYSQTMITGNVIDEDGQPIINYTLKVVGASQLDSLKLFSPNGDFSFEGNDCPYHFTIAYFGEQVLDTIVGCDDVKSHLTFQTKIEKKLEEVIVLGKRPIIKSKLMEDQIQVKGITIFENNNMAEILQKVPGFIQNSSQLTYKSLPVVSVRFGSQGISRQLTADMLQMLESFFAENISSMIFKRLPQGNSYELIVNPVIIKGFETTTTAEYSRGEGDYGTINSRGMLNTVKLANSLYLRTNPYRSPNSYTRQYVFDNGVVKDIEDAKQKKTKDFYVDYANNYSLSKEINAGVLINYLVSNNKEDRTSNVFGNISNMDASQFYRFFTTGVYFDFNKNKHKLHLEMAFNNKNDQYKLRSTNNALLQSMKSNNITPNASVDYTYTFRNPKFKIRLFSSYSYMFLTSKDVFNNTKLQDFWEHTFRQDMYLNGSFGKVEFNAGITFDYSTSHKAHYFYVDPHILLGYEINGHKFGIRYDQNTSRPLSGQLAGITKKENEGIDITGNSDLKPYRNTQLELSYRRGNLGVNIGGCRRINWWLLLPAYQNNKFLYKYTSLGVSHMFTASVYYSQYWKFFYLSPNISLETGNFKTSENNSQYNNKYLAVSLPFGFNYRKHRVNITFSYFPISQFENTKEEPRSNLSFRYTFSTLNNAFRISLFANDIFKQNQMQSRIYANGFNEYRKNNTDTRRVGIQLVYNFSSSNRVKKFSSLIHNVTRN